MNDSLLFEELGRTQTVKDVEAAYKAIFEAKRQFAVRMKHARQDKEKQVAELATFLDDLQQITGLPLESPIFKQIASMTIARRLARRKTTERSSYPEDSSLTEDT